MRRNRLGPAAAGSLLSLSLFLGACGGGGGGDAPAATGSQPVTPAPAPPAVAPAPAVTKADAYRFLNQSTFGATESEASRLIALGDSSTAYARWIDAELAKPASLLLPAVEAAYPSPVPAGFNIGNLHATRLEKWFENVLKGPDQLRQRAAWALSQIFVVSQNGALGSLPNATADFYDLLARDAFGDYRQLLDDVTRHPAMGVYLSMLGNQKAVAGTNLRPDENYAREVMQLMSTGLVQLNTDGSIKRDADGQPLPTYDQSTVEAMARVFTGWKWACPSTNASCTFDNANPQSAPVPGYNQVQPMKLYANKHDTGLKQLFPDVTLPAGQTGEKDLQDALDIIAGHPNVGPFVAKHLILKLVTSNPSAAYVQRVATVFNDDGTGKRGNLGAVVRAILLDAEARPATIVANPPVAAGKVKEPLLRLTQFWRAYDAHAASGKYGVARNFGGGVSAVFGEGPNLSPSVFNFYSPGYAPPGELQSQRMLAPEMQLATEYLNTQTTNFFWTQANARTTTQAPTLNADDMFIDTTQENAAASDPDALIDRVAERLLGGAGQLSPTLRQQAKAQVQRSTAAGTRVADAIFLVATSPDFAVQR